MFKAPPHHQQKKPYCLRHNVENMVESDRSQIRVQRCAEKMQFARQITKARI
jgi:hypothetical protein